MPIAALLVLAGAVFAGVTTEVLPVGLLPAIARSVHSPVGQVGLLVSGYAVVVAAASVPLAVATTRWSRRRTLCVVLAAYALSTLVFACTDSYCVMLAARMVAGLAHAALFPAVVALAVESAPPSRAAQAIAMTNGGTVVALSLGVPLGTLLGTTIGWRWTFAATALLTLTLIVATLLFVDEPAVRSAPDSASPRLLLTRPAVMALAAGIVVLTLGFHSAYTYINPLLQHAGIAAGNVGTALFAFGVAGLIGLTAAGRLGGRRPRAVLVGAVVTSATALVVIAESSTPVLTVLAVVVWGAGFGCLPSLMQTVALRLAPEDTGLAPALVNGTWNVGICGGAAIGGHLLGVSGALPLFAAVTMVASLVILLPVARLSAARRA